jgi:hypothetical protein
MADVQKQFNRWLVAIARKVIAEDGTGMAEAQDLQGLHVLTTRIIHQHLSMIFVREPQITATVLTLILTIRQPGQRGRDGSKEK